MKPAGLIAVAALLLLGAVPARAAQALKIGDFSMPTYVTAPPGDPHRLFVVDQTGAIELLHDGVRKTFLDLGADIDGADEDHGLFSMAFAPDYARSGRFYVYYTAPRVDDQLGDVLTIAEYRRSATDPDVADPATKRVVLEIDNTGSPGHSGGQLQFGPDGMLYVATGDGGDANDPDGNAQAPSSLLGKLLRIDPRPSAGYPYSVPADNPFAGVAGTRPEIYALGLRNPWRFSFDRATGDLVIGDVGQDAWEEIDYAPRGTGAGANYGWRCREGFVANSAVPPCTGDFTDPVFVFGHTGTGCTGSITGGYVVRNHDLDSLYGRYLYVNFCSDDVRSLLLAQPSAQDDRSTGVALPNVTSFGEDSCGHLYAAQWTGAVYALVDDGASLTPCPEPPAKKPPPKKPPTDRTPPRLTVKRKFRQSLSGERSLFVQARCDERCALTATARLHVPGVAGPIALGPVARTVGTGRLARLRLLLTADQARTVRGALRGGHRVEGRIRIVARDAAGNQSGKRRKVLVGL